MRKSFLAVLAFLTLTACGGGGGVSPSFVAAETVASTPSLAAVAVVPVKVTCSDSTISTAANMETAVAACPAVKFSDSLPFDGSTKESPDSFLGITVTYNGTIDPASITAANIVLKAGGINSVASTISASGSGFKVVPATKTAYGQQYTMTANDVKDTLGRIISPVTITFTMAPMNCVLPKAWDNASLSCLVPPLACKAPAVWSVTTSNCVTVAGVKVTGAKMLPTGCKVWTEQCFEVASANGDVQYVASSAVFNGRPVVYAYFINPFDPFGGSGGLYGLAAFYADDRSIVPGQSIAGATSEVMDWVAGNAIGAVAHMVGGTCVQFVPSSPNSTVATCPSL